MGRQPRRSDSIPLVHLRQTTGGTTIGGTEPRIDYSRPTSSPSGGQSFKMGRFIRQMQALMAKNLLVVVKRSPISFLLIFYGLPLAILAVLLSIPSFTKMTSTYGIGSPAPVRDLASTVHKKLVVVRPPHLGDDVDDVIKTFTKPLGPEKVKILENESELSTLCLANLRGVSDCHAAITFMDSPGTKGSVENSEGLKSSNHTWQYIIRNDPAVDSAKIDATHHKSSEELVTMPLQLAINNAITKSSHTPEVFMFTSSTQEQLDRQNRESAVELVGSIYPFAIFACYFFIIYRFTSFITSERESGMAQLIDSMGGGSSTVARVLSWLIVFDIICLPCFIIFGVLYWHILFPTTSVGLLIGWQILLGLAVNSSTIFAASFFTKSRVSSIYVMGAFLLLSVGAQVYSFQRPPPTATGVYPLTLLFSSSNALFFTQQVALFELQGKPTMLGKLPPAANGLNSGSYGVTLGTMLGFLVVQIILYPCLALLVEKFMHGIDFRSRSFMGHSSDSSTSNVVVEAFDLKKRFVPTFLEKVFCCGKRKSVTAVDGVSFQGQKGQILCLLGPNGSGKTTTLHMLSGFHSATAGSMKVHALPSQLGICPQHNTMWDTLTVKEHVYLWSKIKGGWESTRQLDDLIASCDLELKRDSLAKTLSGGQKRKLQLACMFVGDSSVCLIDECTSGLDPLSRRVIWEILLEQRSKRSIIFTTHFLDEVDVLADHIVILTKGKVKCQGAATELKHLYGGGYKVLVPSSAPKLDVEYPVTYHQDTLVYETPDSRSAAQLSYSFTAIGVEGAMISGPQVEDVFLRVADEPELKEHDNLHLESSAESFKMSPGRSITFWGQVGVLMRKRFTILRRFWWPYFYVLAIPLIISPFFQKILFRFEIQSCENLEALISTPYPVSFYAGQDCIDGYYCDEIAVGPKSTLDDLQDLVKKNFSTVKGVEPKAMRNFAHQVGSVKELQESAAKNRSTNVGGIFLDSKNDASVIAYRQDGYDEPYGLEMMTLWSQLMSGIDITVTKGGFAQTQRSGPSSDSILSGTVYAVMFTLMLSIYPAAFTLYPAIEKARKVRAIQYANGVRRGPLWVAYGLFDFLFVFVLSIGVTLIISSYLPWNGPIYIMIPILMLYGLAAILLGYVIAHFTAGPLTAFLSMMGLSLLMFAVSTIAFAVGSAFSGAAQMDSITLGITFGLNIILPIGNVFRAVAVGLNVGQTGCKDGAPTPPGSIYGFGGPILYLVLQIIVLLLIIIWIEGDIALFRRKGAGNAAVDFEKTTHSTPSPEVEAERIRVEQSESDLLRALHLKKTFGSNTAVNNVSFGLGQSEVMALIGPNGAGKSTLVNMIQSELSPDHGRILLQNEDARTRSAQKFLGVCPQHDALDLMTTREHLSFFARVKGIDNVKDNVNHVMKKLNLTPHASTLASKLSGGNKRKLSLAIALLGTPPVLVLDEPTSAMDAVAKRSFWKIIQSISHGRSVLLTTHSMEEADTLANRTAIISRRLLAVGSTQELRDKYSNVYYVSVLLSSAPNSTVHEMDTFRTWIQEQIPGVNLERDMLGGQVRFTIPGVDSRGKNPVADFIHMLEQNKQAMGIEYYSVGGATLENVFLSVVRENNVKEEDLGGDGNRWNRFSRMFKR